ncbi:hypothetical protein ACPYO6_00295 [Georgenia sp. Z1344]|uniref:hypothetical protein n=1 Tax=Georgenia sp. Z1344 TaxID=3416706 RepID=UPI003CEB11A3
MTSIVFGMALLAVLVWQFAGVADDGQQLQVLDPGLHPAGKAVLVGTLAVSLVCSAVAWARRRWTMPVALVNTVANGAGAVSVVVLAVEGTLLSPVPAGATAGTRTDVADLTELLLLLVTVVAIWDSLDGILRALRTGPRATRRHTSTNDEDHS